MMIRLMEGLEIKFGEDGTWLNFDGGNHKSCIRLENLGMSRES